MKFPGWIIITRTKFFLRWSAHNRLPASSKLPKVYLDTKYNDYAAAIILLCYACSRPDNTRQSIRYYPINGDVQVTHDTSPAGVRDQACTRRDGRLRRSHSQVGERADPPPGWAARRARCGPGGRRSAAATRGPWPAVADRPRVAVRTAVDPVEREADVPGGGRSGG